MGGDQYMGGTSPEDFWGGQEGTREFDEDAGNRLATVLPQKNGEISHK